MPIETILSVGDRVSYSDMANPLKSGTIIETGAGWGGRECRIMWDNGVESVSLASGPRWNISDVPAPSEEELAAAKAERAIEKQSREEFAAIPVEYVSQVDTAKLIRKALKAAFPGVKFSVRCSHWSSTDVRWSDGPTSRQVQAVTAQFEGEGFDGMQDLRYSKEQMYTRDDGSLYRVSYGSGLILEQRDISTEVREHCAAICNLYDGDEKVSGYRLDEEVYRFISKTDLTNIDYREITSLYS